VYFRCPDGTAVAADDDDPTRDAVGDIADAILGGWARRNGTTVDGHEISIERWVEGGPVERIEPRTTLHEVLRPPALDVGERPELRLSFEGYRVVRESYHAGGFAMTDLLRAGLPGDTLVRPLLDRARLENAIFRIDVQHRRLPDLLVLAVLRFCKGAVAHPLVDALRKLTRAQPVQAVAPKVWELLSREERVLLADRIRVDPEWLVQVPLGRPPKR
jgi:hypothetical protein